MDLTCPRCGEQVRENCLRCWNCRDFIYAETAAYHAQMQQRHSLRGDATADRTVTLRESA